MPYTNLWDDTLPTGSEPANSIGTIFRALKVDIEERLNDIFGGMPSLNTYPLRAYGLKFTDDADSIFTLGNGGLHAKSLYIKDYSNTITYAQISDQAVNTEVPLTVGASGLMGVGSGIYQFRTVALGGADRSLFSIGGVITKTNAFTATYNAAIDLIQYTLDHGSLNVTAPLGAHVTVQTLDSSNPYFSLMNAAGQNKAYIFLDLATTQAHFSVVGNSASSIAIDALGNVYLTAYGTGGGQLVVGAPDSLSTGLRTIGVLN